MLGWPGVLWHKGFILYFWKEVTMYVLEGSPQWGLCFLRAQCLLKVLEFYCMRDLSILFYLFFESFIYTSIESGYLFYSWVITQSFFIFLLKLFSLWALEAISFGSGVLLWHSCIMISFLKNTSLFSGLPDAPGSPSCISCLSPGISSLPKKAWFLFLEMGTRHHDWWLGVLIAIGVLLL